MAAWDYSHTLTSPTYRELQSRLNAIIDLCEEHGGVDPAGELAAIITRIAEGEFA